jgi:hypothetical protein
MFVPDDLMGVHLKVQKEVLKKKEETLAAGKEFFPITNDMIVGSCIQVSILPTFYEQLLR